jgi:hypothetical protein
LLATGADDGHQQTGADRFPESLAFRVLKRSLKGSGSGPSFGVTGLGLAVAASPVAGDAGQSTRCGPLAYALAPTVEMLLLGHTWSCPLVNLANQKFVPPSPTQPFVDFEVEHLNEPLGAKGPPLVGEEVRKEVGKVGS